MYNGYINSEKESTMTYSVIRNSNFGRLTGKNEVTVLETNDKSLAEMQRDVLVAKGFEVRIEEFWSWTF